MQFAIDAKQGSVAIDSNLGVEKGVAACYSLRDTEVDGDAGTTVRVLDGDYIRAIRLDDDGFLRVLDKGGDLLKGGIALDEVGVAGDEGLGEDKKLDIFCAGLFNKADHFLDSCGLVHEDGGGMCCRDLEFGGGWGLRRHDCG